MFTIHVGVSIIISMIVEFSCYRRFGEFRIGVAELYGKRTSESSMGRLALSLWYSFFAFKRRNITCFDMCCEQMSLFIYIFTR